MFVTINTNGLLRRLAVFTLFSALVTMVGCYERQAVSQCDENADCVSGACRDGLCVSTSTDDPYEFQGSDPDYQNAYSEPMTGVDILFVVDNSPTMLYEQGMMGLAVRVLLLELAERLVEGLSLDLASIDVRFAVTTTDMGLSYGGNPSYNWYGPAEECSQEPFGNEGRMYTDYVDEYNWDQPCPYIDPFVSDGMFLELDDNDLYNNFVDAMTCMMATGLHGCGFVQPMSAAHAAVTKHGQNAFLRKNALTVVVVVSDDDDCSPEQVEWIDELFSYTNERYMCSSANEFLYAPEELKTKLIDAKTEATGVAAEGSVMFAAITGVPVSNACQGRADTIEMCAEEPLPIDGTMMEHSLDGSAYACEVWDGVGEPLVRAHPAMRTVRVAQSFGEMGYVFSICNDNWNYAMSDLADMITERLE